MDVSLKSWEAQKTEGPWSKLEAKEHINILELKWTTFAIMNFKKMFLIVKILTFRKWERAHNKILSDFAK